MFQRREVRLTPEQAAELYRGHYGKHHFPHLVAHMSSGPIIALVLAARNCISKWRTLMGPARLVIGVSTESITRYNQPFQT